MLGFIRRIYKDQNEFKIVVKLSSVFLFAFIFYLIANYIIIYSLSLKDIKNYLGHTIANVASDFEYKDGKWDTDKYLSDISTPTEIPLYIFSTDGFLMDRLNVIHGLLDTSNYEYASSFTAPTTITSPAGETWRIYSLPLIRSDQVKGVTLVAYFDPRGIAEKEIDEVLKDVAISVDSKIKVVDGSIDVSHIKQKEIDPNVSFEIVDIFNRNLMSYGGPPAYLDRSYIQDALLYKNFRTVKDRKNNNEYLVYATPILSNGQTVGIVVAGKGLDQLTTMLRYQLWLSVGAGFLAIIIFMMVVIYIYRHDFSEVLQDRLAFLSSPAPVDVRKIAFSEEKSSIVINENITISIPKHSYQFDVCRLLFHAPNRPKDTIDLADAIGEKNTTKNEVRMVYDAILAINGKTRKAIGIKLIHHEDKQYFINPDLASKIHK